MSSHEQRRRSTRGGGGGGTHFGIRTHTERNKSCSYYFCCRHDSRPRKDFRDDVSPVTGAALSQGLFVKSTDRKWRSTQRLLMAASLSRVPHRIMVTPPPSPHRFSAVFVPLRAPKYLLNKLSLKGAVTWLHIPLHINY